MKYNLQGHKNAKITYGLFYKNELVQLMSFNKIKQNKNLINTNYWEIVCCCTNSDYAITDGIFKLFNYFINTNNPNTIISYCNFNKFSGNSYEKLGMQFIKFTGPDVKYIMSNKKVIDSKSIKHKEAQINYMAKIYGAGYKKYLWSKNE